MAYLPHNLFAEFDKLKTEALSSQALTDIQNPMPLANIQTLLQNPLCYPDPNSYLAGLNPLQGPMALQQLLLQQQPEQSLISQLLLQNESLQLQVQTLTAEKEKLANELQNVERKLQTISPESESTAEAEAKKKRHRRKAKEISREYKCPLNTCSKSYGSEGSLLQHIRLKHLDFDLAAWTAAQTESQKLRSEASLQKEGSERKADADA